MHIYISFTSLFIKNIVSVEYQLRTQSITANIHINMYFRQRQMKLEYLSLSFLLLTMNTIVVIFLRLYGYVRNNLFFFFFFFICLQNLDKCNMRYRVVSFDDNVDCFKDNILIILLTEKDKRLYIYN